MVEHVTKGLDQIEQILKNHIPNENKALSAMIEITPIVHAILKGELDDFAKRVDKILHEVFTK